MKMSSVFAVLLIALAGASVNARAAVCGSGITCFDAVLVLNNANASTIAPLIAYTAPSSGSGAKITAILFYGTAPSLDCAGLYVVHSSVNYILGTLCVSPGTTNPTAQILAATAGGVNAFPNLNTDENGNSYLLLSAGDSIAISSRDGIPASGSTSGTYTFHVMGQAY